MEFLFYSEAYTNTQTCLKFGKYLIRLLTSLSAVLSELVTFYLSMKDYAMTPCQNLEQKTSSDSTQYVRRTKIPVLSTFVSSILIVGWLETAAAVVVGGRRCEGRIAGGSLTD